MHPADQRGLAHDLARTEEKGGPCYDERREAIRRPYGYEGRKMHALCGRTIRRKEIQVFVDSPKRAHEEPEIPRGRLGDMRVPPPL